MENKSIYKKLLEIQKEVDPIKKTETNPYFNSKYFDVNKLLEVLKPMLNSRDLLLIQGLNHEGAYLLLNTQIIDVGTDEKVEFNTILPDGGDAQKQGSAITYFRRYALQSLFALQAEDDDANKASGNYPTGYKPQAKPPGTIAAKSIQKKMAPHDYDGDEAHSIDL